MNGGGGLLSSQHTQLNDFRAVDDTRNRPHIIINQRTQDRLVYTIVLPVIHTFLVALNIRLVTIDT